MEPMEIVNLVSDSPSSVEVETKPGLSSPLKSKMEVKAQALPMENESKSPSVSLSTSITLETNENKDVDNIDFSPLKLDSVLDSTQSDENKPTTNQMHRRNPRKRSRSPDIDLTSGDIKDQENLISPTSSSVATATTVAVTAATVQDLKELSLTSPNPKRRKISNMSFAGGASDIASGFLDTYGRDPIKFSKIKEESYDKKYSKNRRLVYEFEVFRSPLSELSAANVAQVSAASAAAEAAASSVSMSPRLRPALSNLQSETSVPLSTPMKSKGITLDTDNPTAAIDRMMDVSHYKTWIRLSDLLVSFSYPRGKSSYLGARKTVVKSIPKWLKDNDLNMPIEKFMVRHKARYFLSEEGFCVALATLGPYDPGNHLLQHFMRHRFEYRNKIFGTPLIKADMEAQGDAFTNLCYGCGFEDNIDNFELICDCQLGSHVGCPSEPDVVFPTTEEEKAEWFCSFCTKNVSDIDTLKARRKQCEDGTFEVEKVLEYEASTELYRVQWKDYPIQSSDKLELDASFLETVHYFWRDWKVLNNRKRIPAVAQRAIDAIENDPEYQKAHPTDVIDLEMLSLGKGDKKNLTSAASRKGLTKETTLPETNFSTFKPVRIAEIMNPEFTIPGQLYTDHSREVKKTKERKFRAKLERKHYPKKRGRKKSSAAAVARVSSKIPKYTLENANKDWDVERDVENNRQVCALLDRDWQKWRHDTASKSYIIGEITDPDNPVFKCMENSICDNRPHGLFALKDIAKDTVLFEYTGVVARAGAAEGPLKHLEHELDQTTLFTLSGHKHADREKNVWGTTPNDQMVIDPHMFHNEGVYMNDYRSNIMDDPDDETDSSEEEDEEEEERTRPDERDDEDYVGRGKNKSKSKRKKQKEPSPTLASAATPDNATPETEEHPTTQTKEERPQTPPQEAATDTASAAIESTTKTKSGESAHSAIPIDNDIAMAESTEAKTEEKPATSVTEAEPTEGGRRLRPKRKCTAVKKHYDEYDDDDEYSSRRGHGKKDKKKKSKKRNASAASNNKKSKKPKILRSGNRVANVLMYEVLVNGWPHIFAVCVHPIKAGQELLTDYGRSYWKMYRTMLARKEQLEGIKARERRQTKELYQKKVKAQHNALQTLYSALQSQCPDHISKLPQSVLKLLNETEESPETTVVEALSKDQDPYYTGAHLGLVVDINGKEIRRPTNVPPNADKNENIDVASVSAAAVVAPESVAAASVSAPVATEAVVIDDTASAMDVTSVDVTCVDAICVDMDTDMNAEVNGSAVAASAVVVEESTIDTVNESNRGNRDAMELE